MTANNNRIYNLESMFDSNDKNINLNQGVALNPLANVAPSQPATPYMDIDEFQASGLLQEINRLFLHPMGLALEILINDQTGEKSLGGIWDYRDKPEGLTFDSEIVNDPIFTQKAINVQSLVLPDREKLLGYVVQPLPETKSTMS